MKRIISINKTSLNGVDVYPFEDEKQLLDYIEIHRGILVAINAEKILHATDQIRNIINQNIGYCDGIGAVLALRKHGYKEVVKIPGCELWLKIISVFFSKGKTFYLVGGKQIVADLTANKLKQEFPGINILNYRNGYIETSEERRELIDDVIEKKPDIVFVAMGSPSQELLMEEMQQRHHAIYQGLGGSFDVYIGKVERAPKWWIEHNLEFVYRLLRQPSRIKRQIYLIKFLFLLLFNKI